MKMFEVSGFAVRVLRQTCRDTLLTIVHRDITGVTGTGTDTVEWSGTAVFRTVPVAILADSVIIRIFADWTLRPTVRAVLHILTLDA